MSARRFGSYMIKVLAYFRSEWTDVSDNDQVFSIVVTRDLKRVIKDCLSRGVNVPNAARDVRVFMEIEARKAFEPGEGPKAPFMEQGREISEGLMKLYDDWKSADGEEGREDPCGS